ncbi:acyl transferase/acyl hydrolase/lysophospholipase [Phaeosphaeria sp. MPI-PUGE-AT-0046c]|nr:acyl transferase/acyl hydrolase/lysophospholipase [Phaeosphaeria sp. MPI-PUGE-AT-0046c]
MSATGASEPGTQPQKEVCLLSLDGGGVRGISTLMILKILMESIDPKNPPKPCDCFDMIGGTSTGGLIALMLGRLRMSVNECIDAYEKMAHDVFTKPRNPVISKGRLRGRFDHEALERHVKQLLESRAISADALLDDRLNPNSCKTFVCATFAGSDENIILSSYNNRQRNHQRDQDLLKTTKIWEAARATSAVGRFFGPITIGDETFFDKASGESNPIETMLVEAQDMYRRDKSLPDQHIKCIVSIGTGLYFKSDLGHIDRSLKKIAIDAELYAQNFRHKNSKLFDSRRAFRFNVHSGLENIDLEEVAKWGEIKAATRLYMQEEQVHEQIKDFVKNMQTRECKLLIHFI